MDSVTPTRRSEIMARVRARDTKPEMLVRRMVYAMGYRYRLHAKELPGKPDLAFRSRLKAIFVHGCFWHRHPGCVLARIPKSRQDFWIPKLEANRQRDIRNEQELTKRGWNVLTIWECELGDMPGLESRIRKFLGA